MATEEPKYNVIKKSAPFELRAYAPKIIAETTLSGDLDAASSAGFKLIADYIFGNNAALAGGNEKISMTAPVTMEATTNKPSKISMTAPVSMAPADGQGEFNQWRMHFVMPSEYTMDTLPKPNNPAVILREMPNSHYAVHRFSWFAGEEKVKQKTKELLAWMKSNNITPTGKAELARYNPPWTLPFLRRNEIMIAY
ncbi:MAG: heme-binding protein [Methylophilaceae bacterium]|nr:heme-binding protein [Methylophilaceae bacterium]